MCNLPISVSTESIRMWHLRWTQELYRTKGTVLKFGLESHQLRYLRRHFRNCHVEPVESVMFSRLTEDKMKVKGHVKD